MFIRTVSENGNLLLIVNLDGKGALPEVQERRLRDIGKWLKINGEAIYETRPWLAAVQKMEGETVKLNEGIFGGMVSESEVKKDDKKEQNSGEVRFTQSKDGKTVYAICTEFPKGELELHSLYLSSATGKVVMIGAEMTPLEWSHKPAFDRTRLVVKIPESLYNQGQNEHAWVFKITL
jgi:alpha-L-fucosidase